MRPAHLALLLLAAGCPGVAAPLDPPVVALEGVRVAAWQPPAGFDVRVDLRVTNPNGAPLPLRAIDWELSIGDAGPVRGRVHRDDQLAGRATAPLGVAILIDVAMASVLTAALDAGATTYHLRGVLHVLGAHGDVAVAFDGAGTLAMQ